MILIYTGNGKGKTCASVGQAMRAHGQGLRVAFGQFMKQPERAGEQIVCASLFKDRYRAEGCGFFRREEDRPAHRDAALRLVSWAREQLAQVDMLVLDESLYALGHGLVTEDEVRELLEFAREHGAHLVLSGRGMPPWLAEQAELITDMGEVKHPFASGCAAARGIEF
jgi:cob(I)alamin adenosyltransferase